MTEGKKKGLFIPIQGGRLELAKLIVALVLSLVILVAAVCYIASCISIYSTGGSTPFSREAVAEKLTLLLPISLILIALIAAAGVLSLLTAEEKVKMLPIRNKVLLKLVERRLSPSDSSEEYSGRKAYEAKLRKKLLIIAAAASAVIFAAALTFVLNPSNYSTADVNTDVAYAAIITGVATVFVFAVIFAVSIFLDSSYKRVLDAARAELARQKKDGLTPTPCEEENEHEGHTVLLVRLAIIAVAVTFIILGITNGGMGDVLGKAVRICTECIGLG